MPAGTTKLTFESLTAVYREERKTQEPSKLGPHFFRDLASFLEDLHNLYLQESAKNANSPKAMELGSQYKLARERADEIIRLRQRKIVLLAHYKANRGTVDTKALLNSEERMWAELVEVLEMGRETLSPMETDASLEENFVDESNKKQSPSGNLSERPAGVQEGNQATTQASLQDAAESGDSGSENEWQVLLVLEDIPTFSSEDRDYSLLKGDVLTLPSAVAKILLNHNKVRLIQTASENG